MQMLLCLVISIIAIHFCMVLWTLTSLNFNVHRMDWLTLWQSHLHALACVPLLCSLHLLPVKFRLLFKTTLLSYKTLHEKQPVHLHSMIAASLPSHSLRLNTGISLSVPRVKINTGERGFLSCALSLWNKLSLSIHSVISLTIFKKHLRTHLLDLAFPS